MKLDLWFGVDRLGDGKERAGPDVLGGEEGEITVDMEKGTASDSSTEDNWVAVGAALLIGELEA